MRAITLYQPFASWIARGDKEYETRSWSTKYRGEILIHAGLKLDYLPMTDIIENYPRGVVVALATLENVYPTELQIDYVSMDERAVGDWRPDRYAWKLTDVRPLQIPIACKGRQGLWRPSGDLVARVRDALNGR